MLVCEHSASAKPSVDDEVLVCFFPCVAKLVCLWDSRALRSNHGDISKLFADRGCSVWLLEGGHVPRNRREFPKPRGRHDVECAHQVVLQADLRSRLKAMESLNLQVVG